MNEERILQALENLTRYYNYYVNLGEQEKADVYKEWYKIIKYLQNKNKEREESFQNALFDLSRSIMNGEF